MLRRPIWAIGTVICVVLVLLFVRLGFWQLQRHDERRARNAAVESQMERPPVPVEASDREFQRVDVDGTWDDAGTVFVRSRSYQGRPGYHVVTPIVLEDGRAVLVNRGWAPDADAPAVAGTASLDGMRRASQVREGIGPRDPAEGTLTQVARVDIARIQQQYRRQLLPFYVEVQGDAGAEPPFPVEPLELDDGPHLSYAGQWFIFAAIGAVGWVILLRREARGGPGLRLAPPGA